MVAPSAVKVTMNVMFVPVLTFHEVQALALTPAA